MKVFLSFFALTLFSISSIAEQSCVDEIEGAYTCRKSGKINALTSALSGGHKGRVVIESYEDSEEGPSVAITFHSNNKSGIVPTRTYYFPLEPVVVTDSMGDQVTKSGVCDSGKLELSRILIVTEKTAQGLQPFVDLAELNTRKINRLIVEDSSVINSDFENAIRSSISKTKHAVSEIEARIGQEIGFSTSLERKGKKGLNLAVHESGVVPDQFGGIEFEENNESYYCTREKSQ